MAAEPVIRDKATHTFRQYEDGDFITTNFEKQIFLEDTSYKCPVYIQRTPPCQGSCPSGHEIRGWLQIMHGIEKPSTDLERDAYAFYRNTVANPYPSIMGRVCPAPCQDGCNRNEVDEYVGINSVEQYIGDSALDAGLKFENLPELGEKKVAIIGGGPGGMGAAYQLRRRGYGSTVFDMQPDLGGMMRYGIPSYRVPRDKLNGENQRIVDMGGIEVKLNTKIGVDITVEQLEKDYDAIVWAIGCQKGRGLPAANADAPNVITAVEYLDAFNKGKLETLGGNVVCIGGGDTSIDVVTVSKRLGMVDGLAADQRPEKVTSGAIDAQDPALGEQRKNVKVILTAVFPFEEMMATEQEVVEAMHEGVEFQNEVMPLEVIKNDAGMATGLKMSKCTVDDRGIPSPIEGTEYEIEADLIVSAIGQTTDLEGIEGYANERGLMDADPLFRHPDHDGHFVVGDIIRPHLLTTAIGQASKAAEGIDQYLQGIEISKRPKIDVHQFSLAAKLDETDLAPSVFEGGDVYATDSSDFAVHNFRDRSKYEIIDATELFLAHFPRSGVHKRERTGPDEANVLGDTHPLMKGLDEDTTVEEAGRCMSCGMCFECDNCVIYCPQDAVYRVKKDKSTTGRYVATDYTKCIGCHICSDVCPTGYIDMAMGQ
jgi:NADPH-dependent glutamate synthase beta subunit-like oxidoreductase/Pyruvate/2-oxoacid:ferredoxin oxidoreductase delta subunit